MDADYHIRRLSDQLIYIHWKRTPDEKNENAFLIDLKWTLDASPKPQYVLSDLRYGRIISLRTLQQLAKLTEHVQFAGSTAFSQVPSTKFLVGSFRAFAYKSGSKNEMHETLEEALTFLESLKQDVTQNIDWAHLMEHPVPDA